MDSSPEIKMKNENESGKPAFYRLFGSTIEKGRMRRALCPLWDGVPALSEH
jgi:hypothetical protein